MRKLFKNSKQILSFILAFAVIAVSMFAGGVLSVSAAGETVYFESQDMTNPIVATATEDGTVDKPYIIDSVKELYYLAHNSDGVTGAGLYFKVDDNIDTIVLQSQAFADSKDLTGNLTAEQTKSALSSGTSTWWGTVSFAGKIDFNYATVYGMYTSNIGLFTALSTGAEIRNVSFKNAYINSANAIGIFAGDAGDVKFENVEIAGCYLETTANSTDGRAGILVRGGGNANLLVNNCFIHGNIAYTALNGKTEAGLWGYVGAGNDYTKHKITNTIVLDSVPYNTSESGANASKPDAFENVYTDTTDPATLAVRTWGDGWAPTGKIFTVSATDLMGAAAITNCENLDWANTWFAVEGALPVMRAFHNFTAQNNGDTHSEVCDCGCGLSSAAEPHIGAAGGTCEVCGTSIPLPDTIYFETQNMTNPIVTTATEDGTVDKPYIIDSVAELYYLAHDSNAASAAKDKYFKVAEGIKKIVLQEKDFADDKNLTSDLTAEQTKSALSSGTSTWWATVNFGGKIDFNGATVYGLYTTQSGLFSGLSAGVEIKNVSFKNAYITTGNKAGAFGGEAGAVVFENVEVAGCYITSSTTDTDGRVGILAAGGGQGQFKVNNCYIHDNIANSGASGENVAGLWGNTTGSPDYTKHKITNTIVLGSVPYNAVNTSANASKPDAFENVYTDTTDPATAAVREWGDGMAPTGKIFTISAADLMGAAAITNCEGLDWENVWLATDSMPTLRAFHTLTYIEDGDAHRAQCTDCGILGLPEQHKAVDGEIYSPAGCLDYGWQYQSCELCEASLPDKQLDPVGHTFDPVVEEDPADCVNDGTVAYKHCSVCNRDFAANADIYEESSWGDLTLPSPGHSWNVHYAETGSCSAEGTIEYKSCNECELNFAIDADDHEPFENTIGDNISDGQFNNSVHINTTFHQEEPAGCTTVGTKAYLECHDCDEIFVNGEPINASSELEISPTGHVFTSEYSPETGSCCEYGTVAYKKCLICGLNFAPDADVYSESPLSTIFDGQTDDTNHLSTTHYNAVAAGCLTTGNIAYDKCNDCGKLLVNNTPVTNVTVAATGHKFGAVKKAVAGNCKTAGTVAYKTCSVCKKNFAENAKVTEKKALASLSAKLDPNAHKLTAVAKVPAKEGVAGVLAHQRCTVCGKKFINGVQKNDSELTIAALPVTPKYVEGWQADTTGWWYQYTDGSYATGWAAIDGAWYYFDANGYMQTGWVSDGSAWYYMNSSGAMATGWVSDGGAWYYMGTGGAMQTGWVSDGSAWYYMNGSGAMATGWISDGGAWYYMGTGGAMQTGWVADGGAWYYMNSSGAMATGWISDGGTWYYMSGSGAMATGWVLDGGVWYWLEASGVWAGYSELA